MPSATLLGVTSTRLQTGNDTILLIALDPSVPPQPDDTTVEVRFTQLPFTTNPVTTLVKATGEIYSSSNIQSLVEKRNKEAEEAVAHSKTKEERNIFAGFSAAAPSEGDAEGNAEIDINKWVSPNAFVSMNVKKSSAEQADPRQFNIGLTFRKVFTFQGQTLRDIRNLAAAAETQAARNPGDLATLQHNRGEIATKLNSLRDDYLLSLLIDASGRIEGEALNFNVTNAIFDLPLQLASRTRSLGRSAFWNFRIIPAGVELGRNLRSENDMMQKYYIGRFKFGGELNFIYDPEDQENAFPKRIELSFLGVDRYLWRNETAFDQETNEASGISRGHKPWYQMDLKVFLGASSQGRFGFRVNRIRGTLPPTFTDTRAFTFGAIFESADDNSTQQ
jgi:hypothetical protein